MEENTDEIKITNENEIADENEIANGIADENIDGRNRKQHLHFLIWVSESHRQSHMVNHSLLSFRQCETIYIGSVGEGKQRERLPERKKKRRRRRRHRERRSEAVRGWAGLQREREEEDRDFHKEK
jgi:hypothetical protein